MQSFPPSKSPTVSALILNWNSQNHLIECLESLTARDLPPGLEVIVVDNNSSDGSADGVERRYPAVTLVRNDRNLMFAGGLNSGLARARGEYLLLLTPDVRVTTTAVFQLTEYLQAHPDAAAVAPALFYPDGRFQSDYYLRLPSLAQLIF